LTWNNPANGKLDPTIFTNKLPTTLFDTDQGKFKISYDTVHIGHIPS